MALTMTNLAGMVKNEINGGLKFDAAVQKIHRNSGFPSRFGTYTEVRRKILERLEGGQTCQNESSISSSFRQYVYRDAYHADKGHPKD